MTVPIILNTKDRADPPKGLHYIVGANGIHLHLDQWWVSATVPVQECTALESVETQISLRIPPIDATVFAMAVRFFAKVYKKHKTEAYVALHFSTEKGWAITIPRQEVSGAHVRAYPTERIEGFRLIGTMHSHGDMPAFHSGTDVRSEAEFDGVHITVGRIPSLPYLSVDAEVVVRGARRKLDHTFITNLEVYRPLRIHGSLLERWKAYQQMMPSHFFRFPHLAGWTVPDEWIEQVYAPKPLWYFQRDWMKGDKIPDDTQ